MIQIDGSYGLGSGQLTRLALVFSALTKKPIKINKIRSGRTKPGLKAQHLHAVKALEELCNAKSKGVNLYSDHIEFFPNKIKGGNINIKIGTAGCIPLLIQNVIIPMLFAEKPTTLIVTGGTDVLGGPTIDYVQNVILPFYEKFAKQITLKIHKRGYFPKGGGKIELQVHPKYHSINNLKNPFEYLEQGKILELKGISTSSKDLEKAEVAKRQASSAKHLFPKIKIEKQYCDSLSTGSSITLWARTTTTIIGADNLGKKGIKAELIGEDCAKNLQHELNTNAPIDKHMADNLIPLLAIFKGRIKTSEITEHTKTAIWLCEQFINVKFTIKGNIITCS